MFYLTVIILAAGILLRIFSFGYGSLEYDEIWTLTYYVPGSWLSIFTDLATPNNHPLHSLLAKISLGIFGKSIAALRLPALLAGCALMPLLWYTVHKIKPGSGAGLITVAWSSFYGYSLYYSQAARGYSMQMFLVAATFLTMWLLYQKPDSIKYVILLILSAICCCFTITSGLIYVCALAGAFAICYLMQKTDSRYNLFSKKYRYFWYVSCAFLLFALLWYGLNFSKIQQGQQFGAALDSLFEIAKFIYNTTKDLFLYPLLAVCIAGACFKNSMRRTACFALTFFGLIILSAFCTKAGPPRVYLGLYPVLTVCAALILSGWIEQYGKTPQIRILLYLLCILPPALTYQKEWERVVPPDWGAISKQVRKEVPPDILPLYTPPDTYPVRYNDPDAMKDYQHRIQKENIRGIFSVNSSYLTGFHHLTGKTEGFGYKQLIPTQKLLLNNKIPAYFYPLEPVTENSKTYRQPLLLVIRNMPENEYRNMFNSSVNGKDVNWILHNLWFIENKSVVNRVYGLDDAQYEAAHYLEITERSNGHFRFYTFKK